MTLLEIERNPKGPRVRVIGQRVHHGACGLGLVLDGLRRRQWLEVGAGVALAADDVHDWRAWFKPGAQRV